jgi:hypothetical protein
MSRADFDKLKTINSNFQKVTDDDLSEYISTMEIKPEDLENVSLPEPNLKNFIKNFFEGSNLLPVFDLADTVKGDLDSTPPPTLLTRPA